MSGIEEVHAGIGMANEASREALAALAQTTDSVERAQQALQQATQGTTSPEVEQASGLLADVVQRVGELQGAISAAIEQTETYQHRL